MGLSIVRRDSMYTKLARINLCIPELIHSTTGSKIRRTYESTMTLLSLDLGIFPVCGGSLEMHMYKPFIAVALTGGPRSYVIVLK